MWTVSRIAILAIVIGAIARFAFLDSPLFFRDEAITALFTTGHHYEAYSRLFDGKEHAVSEILATMTVDPSLGPIDTVRALALEDPHHAPLFYALERVWVGAFGSSIWAFRSFPAVLGIIGVWLAFVLLREIANTRTAWVGASLFALSPMFVSLSRDAREYALLIDVVLLSTIGLVRAIAGGSPRNWIVYCAYVALGFYTDSLFAFALLSHAVIAFVRVRENGHAFVSWVAASVVGGLAFVPWAVNALHLGTRIAGELDWVRTAYSLKYAALKWVFNLGSLGFDGEFRSLRYGVLAAVIAVVVIAAVAYLIRVPVRGRAVPLSLALSTCVAFVVLDTVQHAHFATIARYMSVAWIGLELGVALTIGALLDDARRVRSTEIAWCAVLVLGVASFAIRGGAEGWWNNTDDIAYRAVAREIVARAPERPHVFIEDRAQIALELARYLPADQRLVLVRPAKIPTLPTNRILLVAPTRALRDAAEGRTHATPINVSPRIQTVYAVAKNGAIESHNDSDAVSPQNALWYVGKTPGGVI